MSDVNKEDLQQDDKENFQRMIRSGRLLGEYFDTVLIICTRHRSDGKTIATSWTQGNAFANEGAANSWLQGEISPMDSGQES